LVQSSDVELNMQSEKRGMRSGLLIACHYGRRDTALALVEAGADVRLADNNLWTALHWACRRAQLTLAVKLVAAGADPNIINAEFQTPLDVYGRSRRLRQIAVSAALKDLREARAAYLEQVRVDSIWRRRWPFLCVLVKCGYRPLEERRLAIRALAAPPSASLPPIDISTPALRLLFIVESVLYNYDLHMLIVSFL